MHKMWPPGYHNNAFMGIPELGHSIYGIFYGYSIIVNLLEKILVFWIYFVLLAFFRTLIKECCYRFFNSIQLILFK